MPQLKTLLIALVMVGTAASRGEGQGASAYIPMDHWSVPYIEQLIRAGVMSEPASLTRPWRRVSVENALGAIDDAALSSAYRSIVDALRVELAPGNGETGVMLDLVAEVGGRTHARRDPLRPAGDGGFVHRGLVHATAVEGPVVFSVRPQYDTNRDRDPDYRGKPAGGGGGGRPIPGRLDEAYVSLETEHVEVAFGNVHRNWGPSLLHGLLVSNVAYSYNHLFVAWKTRWFSLQTLVSDLDDVEDGGEDKQRYWIAHRLQIRPHRDLELWLNQATLLAGQNRQLDFWALNPLLVNQFAAEDETREEETNVFVEGVARATLWGDYVVTGSLMIDDMSLFGGTAVPDRIGWSIVFEGPAPGSAAFSLAYTGVSNLAYRTLGAAETAVRRDVGVGRNFSDYDQLTGRLTVGGPAVALWELEATILRQGEGDMRLPFPPESDYATTPFIFAGIIERTYRLAVGGRAMPDWGVTIRGDAGIHLIRNAGHSAGATRTDFVASVALAKTFRVRF